MNKRIDFTNLGGLPVTQYTLDYLQISYRSAFGAMANLIGDKVIVQGCDVVGSQITNGWISVGGELMPLIGGVLGSGDIAIIETPEQRTFEDGTPRNVYFEKVAMLASPGTFNFSDLKKLETLVNIWKPGNIKEHYCDDAYIAANFDGDGFGVGIEKGWRILSKAVPSSAGKTFVNIDFNDPDFNSVGKIAGEKTHTLVIGELPKHKFKIASDKGDNAGQNDINTTNVLNRRHDLDGGLSYRLLGNNYEATVGNTNELGNDQPHNNLQPSFVILKLIKL